MKLLPEGAPAKEKGTLEDKMGNAGWTLLLNGEFAWLAAQRLQEHEL